MSLTYKSIAQPVVSFPVIRGIQAGREYFVAMWTLRMLRQITIFDDDELAPELRAQRILNRSRVPEIADYILQNPASYVFSALTVSIDSSVLFEPLDDNNALGILHVPMGARFIVNDGQHRRAAILESLAEKPELANETIAIVFFLDVGLSRCQQMFADLNRHAIRPSRSLGVLYDHRNQKSMLAELVVATSPVFRDIVDLERTSLARRSRKLFTLSAMHSACSDLIDGVESGDIDQDSALAREYWDEVAKNIPDWILVRDGKISAGELRESFVHAHGIALHALGILGNSLLKQHRDNWRDILSGLTRIDWAKTNTSVWEGRAMLGGRMSKLTANVQLTTVYLKTVLGVELSTSELVLLDKS